MELLNTLDAISGWQLTPEQRHAIFTLQATLTALELGYQVQEKQIAVHTQAIRRQRQLIGQLLAMINQLKADHKEVLLAQDQIIQAFVTLQEATTSSLDEVTSQLADLRPWLVSAVSFEDFPGNLRDQVNALSARLDALEAQGNGKTPNRRTARKTTAK